MPGRLNGNGNGMKGWYVWLMMGGLIVLVAGMATSIAVTSISLGVCCALAALDRVTSPTLGWRRTPLDQPLGVLVVITFLSALFGLNPARSLHDFWVVWIFLIYYFILWYAPSIERIRILLASLLSVGGLVSLFAILQHYTGWSLLGKHLPTTTAFAASRAQYIASGTFSHHQTFANVYFLIFCLAFSLAMTPAPIWRRALAIALTACLALALIFSFTRGIWLATLVAVLTMAFFRNRKVFLGMTLALAVIWMALVLIPSTYSSRAKTIFALSQNIDRLIIWETSWSMLRDHSLLGIGMGSFSELQEEYLPPVAGLGISTAHAHNTYLQLGIERGLFALVAFGWMWYIILRLGFSSLWYLRRQEGFRLAVIRGAMGGILGFLLDGLFQNNFGDTEVISLIMFLVALIMALRVKQAERDGVLVPHGGSNATA